MRILHVSDLHYHKPYFEWVAAAAVRFDAIAITGDSLGYLNQPADQENGLRTWLNRCPVPIFYSRGSYDPHPMCRVRNPNFHGAGVHRLGDWRVVVADVFSGLTIPEDFAQTVVVTHYPPARTLCAQSVSGGFTEFGRGDVRAMVDTIDRTRLVLSGSVHDPARNHDYIGDALVINPGTAYNEHVGVPAHAIAMLGERAVSIDTGRVMSCVSFAT